MAVPGSEHRKGVGDTQEEIKEEEIFCNYVNQISAPHAPAAKSMLRPCRKEGALVLQERFCINKEPISRRRRTQILLSHLSIFNKIPKGALRHANT
jgi:hypothetical protein